MAPILRGEIVWADLNPARGREQGGHRPAVVISADPFNARSGTIIVMAITSQDPKMPFPMSMELTKTKLPKRSWAKIHQVRTLALERIGKRIGRVDPTELEQLISGLNEIVS
jgi:mRNA interferase MazF